LEAVISSKKGKKTKTKKKKNPWVLMMIEKQHKIGMFDNLQTPEKL
jgi:hypothetical protein